MSFSPYPRKWTTTALVVFSIMIIDFAGSLASADPISVSLVYRFLDNRSANSAGIGMGLRDQFGAITVRPSAGTTATATRNGTTIPLVFSGSPTNPDQFNAAPNFDAAIDGGWNLRFQNGADSADVTTPSIASAKVTPLVTNVTFRGSGPTVSWSNPPHVDAIQIIIRDLATTDAAGAAVAIHTVGLPAGTTSYTVPQLLSSSTDGDPVSLGTKRRYSFEIAAVVSRNGGSIATLADIFSRSRAFFNFAPEDARVAETPAATLVSQVAETPVRKVGDKWVYRETTTLPPGERQWSRKVTEVLPTGGYIAIRGDKVALTFDAAGNEFDLRGREYNEELLRFPMAVGTKWSHDRRAGVVAGKNGPEEVLEQATLEVVAFEKVTVPAGTFDCFRVVDAFYWLNKASTGHGFKTLWYCPRVGGIARSEYKRENYQGHPIVTTVSQLISFEEGK